MAEPTIIIIKKKKGGHAHHGGAWKVAYADFVTAMMALFMVLWLLNQTDESERVQISEYFRTGVMSGGEGVLEGGGLGTSPGADGEKKKSKSADEDFRLSNDAKQIRQRLESAMQGDKALGKLGDNVRVEVTRDGLLISILERDDNSLIFDLASSALKPALETILRELAPALAAMPNAVRIDGHTDANPFSEKSGMTNWALSFQRADRARAVLEANGLPASQVNGVYARAASDPLIADNPRAPQNRRLTILAMREHMLEYDRDTAASETTPAEVDPAPNTAN